MKGVTHVYIGTLTALLLAAPGTAESCLTALTGGALGGILCDLDLCCGGPRPDAGKAGKHACAIVLGCAAVDLLLQAGMVESFLGADPQRKAFAAAGILFLWMLAIRQPHRGGTHSIMAMILCGICAEMLCTGLGVPLAAGMGSHLILDLMNLRPMRLFYPLPWSWSLGLCRSDGQADRLLRGAGIIGTALVLGVSIGKIL